jgi:lysophospholipase L1-like esterase
MVSAKAILLSASLGVAALISPAAAQSPAPRVNPAITPKDRLGESWWANKHGAVLAQIKSNPDIGLIMVGDSITQNYEKSDPPDENFQPIWQQFYAPRKALNLGYSGDATENVLWRLDHGEVDGIHPAVAVVLMGTNNTGFLLESADDTKAGVDAVVEKLEAKLPQTKILLLGILPSGVAEKVVEENKQVNAYLAAKYGPTTGTPGSRVTYLDIGSIFFENGKLNEAIYYDPRLSWHPKPLHPDTVGQRRMAEAIEPTLVHLLNDSPRQHLASLRDVNSALIPVPRLEMDSYDWYKRHHEILDQQKKIDPQVVLIGDSITHFWGGEPKGNIVNGPKSWNTAFSGLRVLNMGFGWDRTQNVLWRMNQGEFEGLHPETVVINIGTNNLTTTENARSNTPEEIVQGILAIDREVHTRCPESRVIVMGILPRGFGADNFFRAPINRVNTLLSKALEGEANTTFLDIGRKYLTPDGTLPTALMNDGTHPTDEGYSVWAKALIQAGIRQ